MDFVRASGVTFDERISIAEDLNFMLRILSVADSLFVGSAWDYRYHQRTGSATHSYSVGAFTEWLYAQDALRAALVEAGVFGDVRERYITQKAAGYSKLVSNIARAPSGADKVSQVRTLSRAFIADHDLEGVAISKLGLRRAVRAALLLLRLGWVHMLLVVYTLKERGSGRR